MEKKNNNPLRISSLSQLHDLMQLPKPLHPLISIVDNSKMTTVDATEILNKAFIFDFYKISYKSCIELSELRLSE